MVKIFIKENSIDFEAHVYMWEDQFEKFVKFLNDLMNEEVGVLNTKEVGRTVGSRERHPKRWTAEERFMLLNPNISDEELVKKIGKGGRSSTSIFMQRAEFVPKFISWARSKGYDSNNISKTIVEEFMEEKDENS